MKKEKETLLPSTIKNKEKRSAVHAKLKHQKKVEKRKKAKAREAAEQRALELGEEPPPKRTPRTIENTREFDETLCKPDDEELFVGNDADEFSCILKEERLPKVMITTSRFNSTVCFPPLPKLNCQIFHILRLCLMFFSVNGDLYNELQRGPAFISDLLSVIPNAYYHKRGTYDLKKVFELPSFFLMSSLV